MEIIKFFKLLNLLLIVLSPCMILTSASGKIRCIESERQALLEFKRDVIDDDGVLSTWGAEKGKSECCNWDGVECSDSGRVTKLDLPGYDGSLRGKISHSLLNLKNLSYLGLSGFDSGGRKIPEFIGSFKYLTELWLQDSNITGDVPPQLGNLTKLQTLILSDNYGLRVKNLDWLSRLSSLRHLDLTTVNLNESDNWLSEIAKLPFLGDLVLSDCQLHDPPSATHIDMNFANNSSFFTSDCQLRALTTPPFGCGVDLSKNYLTSSFTFSWLFNFTTHATLLDLSSNRLDGSIPDAFREFDSLFHLNLMGNMLDGGIPKSLGNLSHIGWIDISKNKLNVPLVELFNNFSSTSLMRLDLSYNQLSGPLPDMTRFSSSSDMTRFMSSSALLLNNNRLRGFLPQSLGQSPSLQGLDLSCNQIGGELLQNLTVYWQLEYLDVSSNSLEGTITEEHLSNFTRLRGLYLSFNSFTFDFGSDWVPPFQLDVLHLKGCDLLRRFPKWIETQSHLDELDMSYASISEELPRWLWNTSIQTLNLSHNNIGGNMPDFSIEYILDKFVGHHFVDLSYNNFSGRIPLSIFPSREVQLSNNKFSGSISHLCRVIDMFNIFILDLSDNQLSGEIPDCWKRNNALAVLNLANNRFLGKIPHSLGALDNLQALHLRNNSLIGELPTSLKNCGALRIIDLGENNLTGNVPTWIGTYLANVTVLSLRLNKFHGNIPRTICRLSNVQILDLSRNNISGRIPRCLNNFTSLAERNGSTESSEVMVPHDSYNAAVPVLHRYFDNVLLQWKGHESQNGKLGLVKGIDLSRNKLVGTIPREFSDMKGLVFLNLSRNHLTGNIIPNIGEMETLEWLDLSRNQLSGEIPNSLALLHFLSILNLSYNNLTGKIPLGTQLQSFSPFAYAGNNKLCGRPLAECTDDVHGRVVTNHGDGNIGEEDDDEFITRATDLNLSNCNFTGDVPHQLGNLTKLQTLELSDNYGLRVKNLDWLSRLSSLRYLDLRTVNLNESDNWLSEITKLPLLGAFWLSDCQLHDAPSATHIDMNFANSSFFTGDCRLYNPVLGCFVDLSKNYLTSSFTFNWLFNFTRYASELDLSGNRLDGSIPDTFWEFDSLVHLNLKDNMLDGGIPKSLGNLSNLSTIDISKNMLNVPLVELFNNFSSTSTPYRLDLSYNQLSGPLPDITRISSLVELALNNNRLRGFLPQSLGLSSSLENLYLSCNQIGGELLQNLSVYSQLQGLSVDSNSLEGTITEEHLSNFSFISFLDLSFNSLAFDFGFDWVPPFHLQVLRLKGCNLGPRFPKWVETQKFSLSELDMSYASISDELPKWLQSSYLRMLNLSHNNIGGNVPYVLPQFINLSYNNFSGRIPLSAFQSVEVDLSKNNLSGSISHLCRITDEFAVKILDLSDNQLSEELPDCWANKSELVVLNLANNRFSGKIPYSLGALDQLQALHLRNNSLTGELPSSLKNCGVLKIIDLGENDLTGNVPTWMGTHLTNVTVLSLRLNKFHGNIPRTICRLTNIQILDLSRNNMSGQIPRCLNSFTSLAKRNSSTESSEIIITESHRWGIDFLLHRYFDNVLLQWKGQESQNGKLGLVKGIDLSSNNLVGTIPREFSDMKGLVFLNLSRNNLMGNIIPNIGEMETLEWLDLSRNQLSGEIPKSLALLHFLSVLDLSYNNLTGKIPLSTQLQSFNPSAYAGNNKLCGRPLAECPGGVHGNVVTNHGNGNIVEENDDEFITRGFYICMAFGFIVGFWMVIGPLYLKHSWRISYFRFSENIGDWMCAIATIYAIRFKRKIFKA